MDAIRDPNGEFERVPARARAVVSRALHAPAYGARVRRQNRGYLQQPARWVQRLEISSLLLRIRADALGFLLLRSTLRTAEEKTHLKFA